MIPISKIKEKETVIILSLFCQLTKANYLVSFLITFFEGIKALASLICPLY